MLLRRLSKVQGYVNDCVTVPLTQNQNDAIVSFASDIGVRAFELSTALRLLNAGNFGAATDEIRRWTRERSNGAAVERPALVKRREAEARLFAETGRSTTLALSLSGAFSAGRLRRARPVRDDRAA